MLPDYPKTKERLAEVFRERMELVKKVRLSVFSDVPATQMHEGALVLLRREDGEVVPVEPNRVEARAAMTVNFKEVEKLDPGRVIDMLDALADGLAGQQFASILGAIGEAAEKVGNVTTPGLPLVEKFFEALEKRQLDFEPDGSPAATYLLVGSEEAAGRLRQVMREIESTPELRERHEAIMRKKREEWRVREAARNLAE